MYVAACNRVGSSNGTDFFGHSMIIDPWGEIVAEAGEEETILTAEIDLELVEDVRRRIPVFEDRRPALYKLDAGHRYRRRSRANKPFSLPDRRGEGL